MPAKKQGDSFVLKHRLAGAAVLIGFAVIVLPMLLGGPAEDPGRADDAAASRQSDTETRVFRSNITPIGGATPNAGPRKEERERTVGELLEQEAATPSGAGAEQAAAPSVDEGSRGEGSEPEAGGDEQVAARSERSDSSTTRPADGTAEPKRVERGWIVQVGTFRKAGNVDKLVAELEKSGFGPSTSDVETSGGSATRVWVGPFETRVEAARVKNRVTQKTGSEALIVAYP